MAVQRPHDADPRQHRRAARCCDQDQGFHGRLPFLGLVLGFWNLRDVGSGILQGDELSTARQWDRFIERALPAAISH
jgi:hypothetical protein